MKAFQQNTFRLILVAVAAMAMAASAQRVLADGVNNFTQTNLVSDIPGLAKTTDPDLVNPWGVSFSATSPFWVSDNGTGVATLYNGNGDKQGLTVTIPGGASGMGAPTGVVFNSSTSFNSDVFILRRRMARLMAGVAVWGLRRKRWTLRQSGRCIKAWRSEAPLAVLICTRPTFTTTSFR